ncbi:Imm1 family immunity protein [Saccharothrix longispora]|uniref:Imm1 family immunity protein n=1 Tax=Saccharothrix longispora TaxID=33920 RepID=UPI0028FD3F45|nr:Imm1 family immunity protein [Saccharothrix longispora]MDU0293814.1 Imm1 family immunity protein [Saccharothrix longispora]
MRRPGGLRARRGAVGRAWRQLGLAGSTDRPSDGACVLYMDKATRTPFPSSASVPLESWRAALRELLQTGRRPTCVRWQDTDVF